MSRSAWRAVLVAPTTPLAAALGAAFDEARVATTPAELAAALDAGGYDCVVVSALDAEQLAPVAGAVRGRAGLTLLVDAAGPAGADVLHRAPWALAGFAAGGLTELAGSTFATFTPAADPAARPALLAPGAATQEVPADRVSKHSAAVDAQADPPAHTLLDPPAHTLLDAPVDTAAATRRADRLAARVADLEAELALLRDDAAGARAAAAPTEVRPAATRRRPGLLAAAAGVVAIGVAVVLAVLTGTGYVGALAGVLVALVVVQLGYAWHTNRWRAAVDRRTAAAFERLADRHERVLRTLVGLEDRDDELGDVVATLAENTRTALLEARLLAAARQRPAGST